MDFFEEVIRSIFVSSICVCASTESLMRWFYVVHFVVYIIFFPLHSLSVSVFVYLNTALYQLYLMSLIKIHEFLMQIN